MIIEFTTTDVTDHSTTSDVTSQRNKFFLNTIFYINQIKLLNNKNISMYKMYEI